MSSSNIEFIYQNKIFKIENPDTNETLLNYIRTKLKKTGTKEGCAEGGCGGNSSVRTRAESSWMPTTKKRHWCYVRTAGGQTETNSCGDCVPAASKPSPAFGRPWPSTCMGPLPQRNSPSSGRAYAKCKERPPSWSVFLSDPSLACGSWMCVQPLAAKPRTWRN